MLLGVSLGYLLRERNMRWVQKVISPAIWLLLFLLGLVVGKNENIMEHLDTLGMQALLLAVGGVGGSVVLAWGVYRFFFKNEYHDLK